jgi:Bacterial self-protective colicin-like immunity
MPAPSPDEWIALIRRFVDGSISADEFAEKYCSLEERAYEATDEGQAWVEPDGAAWILHDLSIKIDCLSSEPESREEGTGTDELRRHARRVLVQLEQLAAGFPIGPGFLQRILRLAIGSIFLVGSAVLFAGYALWRTGRWLALQIARPILRD